MRNDYVVEKQAHIRKDGSFEIWKDEPFRKAYHRIFDKAVKEYNEKQSREDRKIKNYYSKIEQDTKKHTVYEMIIGIYGKDIEGNPICDQKTGKEIMQRFYEGWAERNPSMELIGAYYHADEDGEPHVHLDYIPVAHGYKNGMETQNGLVKAFEQMGIRKKGRETAQIQWEARENKCLEAICNEYGLSVDHPELDASKHVHTETYKAQKELEKLKTDIDRKADRNAFLELKTSAREEELEELEEKARIKRSEMARIEAKQEIARERLEEEERAVERAERGLTAKKEELHSIVSKVVDLREQEFELRQENEKLKDSIQQAKEEELEALRDAETAKVQGNVFREASEALRRLERAKTINVSVQKETAARDGIFGHTRATVTIDKADFEMLMQRDRDISRAEGMYKNVCEAEERMELYARVVYKNRIEAPEIAIQARVLDAEDKVKEKEHELELEKEKNREAQKEISGLKKQIEELKEKLHEVIGVLTYFPRKWKEMKERTANARKMERMYERNDCHTISSFNSTLYYRWDGRELDTEHFLEAYQNECRAHDLNPNREMTDQLERIYERRYDGPVR